MKNQTLKLGKWILAFLFILSIGGIGAINSLTENMAYARKASIDWGDTEWEKTKRLSMVWLMTILVVLVNFNFWTAIVSFIYKLWIGA